MSESKLSSEDYNTGSIRKKVQKGAGYLYATQMISRIIKPVFTIFIMRILSPADYGIIAIANVLIAGLHRFEDFGINTALIGRRDFDERIKANGLTIRFIIAGLLFMFAQMIAPFWAEIYELGDVAKIIRLLSIVFVVNSFCFIDNVVLIRNFDFKRQAVPELSRVLINSSATLIFAIMGFKYWSIVYGALCGNLIRAILFKAIVREKIRFAIDKDVIFSLLNFGAWVLIGSLFFWAYTTIDNALIGKMLGPIALGYYAVAYRWGNFAAESIQGILPKVLYPAYSSMKGDIARIRNAFLKVSEINALMVVPVCFGMIAIADYFILVLLGDKWYPAYHPLIILCVFGLLRSLQSSGGSIFLAVGKPKINTYLTGLTLGLMLILLYPFIQWKGITGASIAVTISFFISFIIQIAVLSKLIQLKIIELVKVWIKPLMASALMLACIYILKPFLDMSLFPFMGLIAFGVVAYSVLIMALTRGQVLKIVFLR